MNICFGGSEESSHCDGSFDHSHLMLLSVSPDICSGCSKDVSVRRFF